MKGGKEGGKLLFWSYLAFGVTLQLLSLLSLAERLKRTVRRRRRRRRKRRRREGWRTEGTWGETNGELNDVSLCNKK